MIIFLQVERARKEAFEQIRRKPGFFRVRKGETLVVKFGTNSLRRLRSETQPDWLNIVTFGRIAAVISFLYEEGIKPVIVSSGAVAAGMMENGLHERPKDTGKLQDLSTDGVPFLTRWYNEQFGTYGIGIRYIPVTWHCFETPGERENISRRVESSWGDKKIVVFNTNDALTSEELTRTATPYRGIHALLFYVQRFMRRHSRSADFSERFYDNDILAARVTGCVRANALVFFSDPGYMGTGGGETKRIAISMAQRAGIRCAVYSIDDLENVFGLDSYELSNRSGKIYRAMHEHKFK